MSQHGEFLNISHKEWKEMTIEPMLQYYRAPHLLGGNALHFFFFEEMYKDVIIAKVIERDFKESDLKLASENS